MRILVIPDLHAPFQHPKALEFIGRCKKRFKPHAVICLGDLVDQHALSRFTKSTRSNGPQAELYAAQSFIQKLGKLCPVMKVCLGNHDLRFAKRAEEAGLSPDYLKSFSEIIGAPEGWSFADSFEIDGVTFTHGDGLSGPSAAQNAIKCYFRNVCFGHTHQMAIQFLNGIWSFNAGCLINSEAYAFEYARHSKFKPTLGLGLIEDDVPRFIPLTHA